MENENIPKNIRKEMDPIEILASHFVTKAYGIIGYPKFLDGHYLYLITKKKKNWKFLKWNCVQDRRSCSRNDFKQRIELFEQLGKS